MSRRVIRAEIGHTGRAATVTCSRCAVTVPGWRAFRLPEQSAPKSRRLVCMACWRTWLARESEVGRSWAGQLDSETSEFKA
jgi:hypothetical protein